MSCGAFADPVFGEADRVTAINDCILSEIARGDSLLVVIYNFIILNNWNGLPYYVLQIEISI